MRTRCLIHIGIGVLAILGTLGCMKEHRAIGSGEWIYYDITEVYTIAGSAPMIIDVSAGKGTAGVLLTDYSRRTRLGGKISRANGLDSVNNFNLLYTPPDSAAYMDDYFRYTLEDGAGKHITGAALIHFDVPETLSGHWKFDEQNGVIAGDSSARMNHGELEGGITLNLGPRIYNAKFGGALYLDGVDDQIKLPPLNIRNREVTLTGWIKRNGYQRCWNGIICNRGDNGAGLLFGCGNELRYFWNGKYSEWDSGCIVSNHSWTFVALIIEPAQATIYMNNLVREQYAVHPADHGPVKLTENTYIGWDPFSPARHINGAIDDFRVYNYALNPEELETVMNGGLADCPLPVNGAAGVNTHLLSWTAGSAAIEHDIYFGKNPDEVARAQINSPVHVATYPDNMYRTTGLEPYTTYYWRVDTVTGQSVLKGNLWTFATGNNVDAPTK